MSTPQPIVSLAAGTRKKVAPGILFDRDGTIIEEVAFLTRPDDVKALPGIQSAIGQARTAGFRVGVCTNQSVLARGELDERGLQAIHARVDSAAGPVDGYFSCPHHPEPGTPNARPQLTVACACRKPAPGLITAALRDLNLDARDVIYVGDRTTDLQAALNAGVTPVGVRTSYACRDGKHPLDPRIPVLADAAEAIRWRVNTVAAWEPHVQRARSERLVLVGGASRAGKTLAAAALVHALRRAGMRALHVSADAWIVPASQRSTGMPTRDRLGTDAFLGDLARLAAGQSVEAPGYDPATRERGPPVKLDPAGVDVIVVDGIFVGTAWGDHGWRVYLHAEPLELRERRKAFYAWKGVEGDALIHAVDGRGEEADMVEEMMAIARCDAAALHVRLEADGSLVEVTP